LKDYNRTDFAEPGFVFSINGYDYIYIYIYNKYKWKLSGDYLGEGVGSIKNNTT
jgi:hypothetical protein